MRRKDRERLLHVLGLLNTVRLAVDPLPSVVSNELLEDAQTALRIAIHDIQLMSSTKPVMRLDEWIALYASGSVTSRAAAKALSQGFLRGREKATWDFLFSRDSVGGDTDDALTRALKVPGKVYKDGWARGVISGRNNLVRKGCVYETGERRVSLDTGKLVAVWAVTPYSVEMRKQGRW